MAAMSEVLAWRKLVRTWLVGLSMPCSNRVFYGWPQSPPEPPMLVYGLSRGPLGDYPLPSWTGTLSLTFWAGTGAELDAHERAVLEALANDEIMDTLTDDDVRTEHFALSGVGEDVPAEYWTEAGGVINSRTIEIAVTFHGRG